LKDLFEKIKQRYTEIPVHYKKALIIGFLIIAVISVGFIKSNVDQQKVKESKENVVQEVPLTRDALEKSYYIKALEEKEKEDQQIKQLEASLSDLKKQLTSMERENEAERKAQLKELRKKRVPSDTDLSPDQIHTSPENKTVKAPPPPPKPPMFKRPNEFRQTTRQPLSGNKQNTLQQKAGGIAMVSNPDKSSGKNEMEEQLKKKNRFLLPPSFMEATLLSGLDAPTSEGGKAHPVPMFFRVKAPAILPNEVRANLKGCFIIGEGTGRLDTERIDVRLVNISCVDVRGNGIIVSLLKGYIVDADSKIGLHGRVVSKMGSVLAKHLLAGILGGLANTAENAGTSYSTTEFGIPVQSVSNKHTDALKSGIGTGLSDTFKNLQQFYLDLAKQTLPVIEVGALKEVVAVISKEVTLEIKEIEQ
jgi:conjugal transfer pilus assembly protein TraB